MGEKKEKKDKKDKKDKKEKRAAEPEEAPAKKPKVRRTPLARPPSLSSTACLSQVEEPVVEEPDFDG